MSYSAPPADNQRPLGYLDTPPAAPQPSWDDIRSSNAPRRRRRRIVVGALVLVLVAFATLLTIHIVNRPPTGPTKYRLTAPQRIGDFQQVADPVLQANIDALKSASPPASIKRLLADAALATYTRAKGPTELDVVAYPTPDVQNVVGELPASLLPDLPKALTYPPGALGGNLSCGQDNNQIDRVIECAWRDDTTIGHIVLKAATISLAQAAQFTNTVRAMLEH